MGRASRRKKISRAAQGGSRQARRSGAGALTPEAFSQLAAGLRAMNERFGRHREQYESACRVWCAGDDPDPVTEREWPEGSLGDRFVASMSMEEAQSAPSLLTADVPGHAVITASSAHWAVAANALIRAVAFDGLRPDHLVVSTLLDVLGPIAEAELAYGRAMEAWLDRHGPGPGERQPRERDPREPREEEPEFPEEDGPVFLMGSALMDAAWTVVGDDPVREVHAVLARDLDNVVPGLEGIVAADALIGAFAREYRCDDPGDAELLDRIGRELSADALENLVAAKAVPARDVLQAGLAILSVLTGLCRSESVSVLRAVG